MAFLDLDGLKVFLGQCDKRFAAKSHSHSQYYDSTASRTANTVLAAPNGSNGGAAFRKLVAADIPSITKSKISDFPTSMPASDVKSWAKASSKPSYAFSEITGQVNAASQITGTIPSSCLPSYVDDVIEGYLSNSKFYKTKGSDGTYSSEITGETGKIYTDLNTSKIYRWSGSAFVVISETLALGTTSSTAYRGDWGATAKAHADAKGTAFSSGLYKITTNAQGNVTAATAVTKADITALGIPGSDTNTDTHWTTGLVAGAKSGVANAATSNGNTYINVKDNSTFRSGVNIKGSGATTVTSDANGVITINSTDTNTNTWIALKGATTSAAGTAGYAPAPAAGAANRYLRSDGTWSVPPDNNTTYSDMKAATASAAGTHGLVPAPAAGKQTSFLRGDGTWAVPTNTTYSAATTSAAGLMSASDKNKLDGITASADSVSFTRSLTSGTKVGTITINGTGTDIYCQTNTNTTYSAGTGLGLSGTTFSLSASGVTAGSYGPSGNVNGTNGATISVPQITVDAYGRVTSVTNRTYTSVNTDTNTTYSAIPDGSITALFS